MFIEDMLRDYPNYDSYINEVEEAIRHPYVRSDENIGGSKISFKQDSLTATLVRIEDDKKIRYMKKQKEIIDNCLLKINDEYIFIICNELYFKKHVTLNLQGVANKLNLDKSRISRRRLKFFELVAKEMGFRQ